MNWNFHKKIYADIFHSYLRNAHMCQTMLHRESKKGDTILSSISLLNIGRFS